MKTLKAIAALWKSQPLSEKIGAVLFVFGFPLLILGLMVIAP